MDKEDRTDKLIKTITRTALTEGVVFVATADMSATKKGDDVSVDGVRFAAVDGGRALVASSRTDLVKSIGKPVDLIVDAAEGLYDPDSGCNEAEFSYGDNRVILERHLGFWIAICVFSGSSVGKSVRRMIRKIAKNLPRHTP